MLSQNKTHTIWVRRSTVSPFAVHPFQVGEQRTINEFVGNACRQQLNLGSKGERVAQPEFGLWCLIGHEQA
jgi:hypothetical protein